MSEASLVLVVSGPAGSGKTTLCSGLEAAFPGRIRRLVTTTSRSPRPGEREGTDYHFLPESVFKQRIQEGRFIEWARVHGRYYGSETGQVLEMLERGCDLLLNIDVQGAAAFREAGRTHPLLRGRVHTLFVKPQSLEQLRRRMEQRGQDASEEIERRLQTARTEIAAAPDFDHVITSGSKEADLKAVADLYLRLKKGSTPG